MIKILIGGSPCTFWSIAQKNNREITAEGQGWELFKNYLIAKEKFKPDIFLYENNKSAAQPIKDQIKQELSVDEINNHYIEINSALVSAQNRQRFYVHNCGNVKQPEDRHIYLKDILQPTLILNEDYELKNIKRFPQYGNQDKSRPITAHYPNNCGGWFDRINDPNPAKQQIDMIAEPVILQRPHGFNKGGVKKEKAPTITANGAYQKNNLISEPIRLGDIGSSSQAHRVYSYQGKSVTINAGGGGQGGKTGLYACPVKLGEIGKGGQGNRIYSPNGKSVAQTAQSGGVGSNTGLYFCPITITSEDGTNIPVFTVKNNYIFINNKEYPIPLDDGYYIIRKLTPIECERLQTMPDNYTEGVSNAQRYKALGNGWTAEVVLHILNNALKDVSKDEQIVVLSMYDGIATGRYILDKLGFKNVTYYAYEIDKYAIQIAQKNYPDIIQCGDAFAVRNENWRLNNEGNE